MQAVILAAGKGSRLGADLNGKPKCLLEVGERTLLEHQIQTLQSMDIRDICVVVGYQKEMIVERLSDEYTFITNTIYAETNSLYSLWLTREWITGSFLLMNSDVIAHPDIYRELISYDGTALAYDPTSGDQDEHMKVSFDDGRLQAISKSMPTEQSIGENLGILKFDEQAARLLFHEADKIVVSGELKAWAPAAVDRIASQVLIYGIEVTNKPWAEIDFPEDLNYAQKHLANTLLKTQDQGNRAGYD